MRKLFLALLILAGTAPAQITFTRGSTTYPVGRTWVDISETNYFDSYLQSNIFLENPSMQSLEVAQNKDILSGIVGASCSSNSCQFTTQNDYDGAAANYWVGVKGVWSCKAGSGTAPGDCGLGTNQYGKTFTITANGANNTSSGQTVYTYTMDDGSTPVIPTAHDSVTLNTPETATTPNSDLNFGAFGWDTDTSGTGTVTVDTTSGDLPPSLGIGVADAHQCIRLHNANGTDTAGVRTFFDSTGSLYYNFNGTYTGKIYLTILSGSPTSVEFWGNRGSGISWSQAATLSGSSWADRTVSITLAEPTTAAGGTVTMGIRLHGAGDVCIVNARMTNNADTGTYRNEVVADLTALKLGGIRFNAPPGSHLLNLITPQGYRRPSSFWGSNHPVIPAVQQGLVESLNLAEQLGLPRVSFAAQVTWTPTDFANLMEFLGGSSGTTWGAKRVALGHPTPYTSVFQELRIESGNEVWNCSLAAGFACYNLNQSGGYWNYPVLVKNQCAAMKASASYSSVMDCSASIITDPNSGPFEADQIAAADPTHQITSMAINQYVQVGPTNCGQYAQYTPAWVNPLANTKTSTQSGFSETATEITAKGYKPWAYEFQNHTIQGSCTQAQITGFAEGQGFGLTDAMLPQYANKALGVQDNGFWQYTQISANISTSGGATTNNIWGIINGTAGGAFRLFRGGGLAIMQANDAMGPNPIGVNGTNSGVPTFNFTASNNVNAVSNVPYLQEFHYGSTTGTQRSTVVYNIDPTNAYTYTINGADAPTGTVTYTTYASTGNNVQDSNEGANATAKIVLSTTTGAPGSITIQPHTSVAAKWNVSTTPVTCNLAANVPTYGVNFLPGSSRHITFTYSSCPSGAASTADHVTTPIQQLTLHGTFTNFYTSSNSLIQFTNCNSPFDRWMNGATLPIVSANATTVIVSFTNSNVFTGSPNTCTLTEIPKVSFTQATTTGTVTATLTPNSAGLPDVLVTTSAVNGHCTATGSAPSYTLSSTQAMNVIATSLEDGTKTATYPILQCGKTTYVDIPGNTNRQAFIGQSVYLVANVIGDADKRITWSTTCGTLSSTNTRNTTIVSASAQTCTVTATSISNGAKTATANIRFIGVPPSYYTSPPNKSEIQPCDVTDPRFTTVRQVGPTKAFTTVNAALTQTLPAALMVALYNEDTGTTPTTYAEWSFITGSAYVCGVPNALGYLPIIDGDHAIAPTWATNTNFWGNGLMSVNHYATCSGYYAGGSCGPIGVTVANIVFKHADASYQFYDPSGTLHNWGSSAAVSVRTGQHISVTGNSCDTDAICVGSYSGGNGNWADATQGLDDSGNYAVNYGTNGSFLDHGHYIQSLSVNISRNLLGSVLTGMTGSAIKSRSIGAQIAFNRVESGPQRGYDGVDCQDWSMYCDLVQYLTVGGPYDSGDTFGIDGIVGMQEALYEVAVIGNVFNQAGNEHNIGDQIAGTVPNAYWPLNAQYSHHSMWMYNTFYNPGVVIDESAQQQVNWYMLNEHYLQNNSIYDDNAGVSGGFSTNTSSSFIAHMQTNLYKTGSVVNTAPIYGGQNSAGEAFGWSGSYNDGWGIGARPLDPHLFTTTSTAADYLFTSSPPFNTTTFVPTGAALGAATALTGVPSQFAIPFNAVNLSGVATPRTSTADIGAVQQGVAPPAFVMVTGSSMIQ